MKKNNYVKPQTREVSVSMENVMVAMSQMVTGGYEPTPRMGTDGEGQYGEQEMLTWKNL